MTSDEKFKYRMNKLCYWHRWFAWYPVTVCSNGIHHKVWLETVGRKCKVYSTYGESYGSARAIGEPIYCTKDELFFNALKNNEIIDETE